jgi:Flp pilus assembly protein TadG
MNRVRGCLDSTCRRRAATALEFAVILPVLLTLVLGCVDFGRFAHSYIVVTNAARTGASFAAVNPYTPETYVLWQNGVQQAVRQEMSGLSQFDAQALVVQTTVIAGTNQSWSAQVDVSYPFYTLVAWPGIPAGFNLRQTVVMPTIRP